MHFNQLAEKSHLLNQENLILKQRLNELESKSQINTRLVEENIISKYTKQLQQVEQDQSTLEYNNITIQNLEVLSSDLKNQLGVVENLFTHEKITTKNFQAHIEGLVAANKENLENLKGEDQRRRQEMENLIEQKINLEKRVQSDAVKMQNLETENMSLKTDMEFSVKENQRLVEKTKEYEDIIAVLKKSLDEFIIQRDGEISRIKVMLGNVEKELFKKTNEYELLKTENYELNLRVSNMALMSSGNRIEQLEKELERREISLKAAQEQIKQTEKRFESVIEKQEEKAKAMAANNQKNEEMLKELQSIKLRLEEAVRNCDQSQFENNELKLKLFEYEEIALHNASLKEKIALATEESKRITEEMGQVRKNLFVSSKELLEKSRLVADLNRIVKDQEQQIRTLEDSLGTAFEDIKRLHLNCEGTKKGDDLMDLPPVRKNDEVDVKLREIMIKTKVPIKFIRIGEGLYIFGSKRVHVKILNSKLVIRIGGGYMYVEEFIRLYAHQELAKLKNREDIHFSDTDQEEFSLEMRNNQLLQQEDPISNDYLIRELEQFKASDIKVIASTSGTVEGSPIKRNSSISFLENRRASTESKSCLTQDFSSQSFTYEIAPKPGNGIPSGKTRSPEKKRTTQNDGLPNLRIPETDNGKRNYKIPDLSSARDTLSSSRGYSRRSLV